MVRHYSSCRWLRGFSLAGLLMLVVSLLVVPEVAPPQVAHAATDCAAQTDIPQAECEALLALYNATDGPNWQDSWGWNDNRPCTWSGVRCRDGSVTELVFGERKGLNGNIPPELGNLTNLTMLIIDENQLSGSIPPELGSLAKLGFLDLSGQELSGSIPLELSNLTNLTSLNLGGNRLSGSIPPELNKLTKLYNLSLGSNQLSGSIPPELGNLADLTDLNLAGNYLSGSIPPELGNLSKLSVLRLNNNRLSGSIPPELGSLTYINTLDLDDNQLTGDIPLELANMNRPYLDITYNYLNTNVTNQTLLDWLNNQASNWQQQYGSPGSIAGTVRSESGTPLAGITVAAYAGGSRPYASTTTTSDGSYTLEDIASNIPFELSFSDMSGTYEPAFYGDGDPVYVTAGTATAPIDVTLTEYAAPLATVTTSTGSVNANPGDGTIYMYVPSDDPGSVTISYEATCPTDDPTSVALRMDDGTTYPMAQLGDTSTYEATVSLGAERGWMLSVQVECTEGSTGTAIGSIEQFEPNGVITDAVTGDPIAEASVQLYYLHTWAPKTSATDNRDNTCHTVDTRPDDTWEKLPPARAFDESLGAPTPHPDDYIEDPMESWMFYTRTTTTQGHYGVAGWGWWYFGERGCWYIEVHAEGYMSQISPVVSIVPEVTGLDLALEPLGGAVYLPMVSR